MRSFFFLEGSESEIGNNLKIAFLSLCMINSLLLNLGPKREFSYLSFPGGSDGKVPACKVGDPGLIPGSGRSPGEGNGHPLQYSCLENSMDGGAWWPTVQGVTKSQTQLSNFTLFENTVKNKNFMYSSVEELGHENQGGRPSGLP